MKKGMKFIFLVTTILSQSISYGQEFLGIKVEGKLSEVVYKLKQKGFKITRSDDNNPFLEGKAGLSNVEVLIGSSPLSKTVYNITVYLPKRNDWDELKSEYEDYLRILTEKYGEPSDSFHFFSPPYVEGGGDEMNAIAMEKCNYSAYWKNLQIEITEFKQVAVIYRNEKNFNLMKLEKAQIKKSVF